MPIEAGNPFLDPVQHSEILGQALMRPICLLIYLSRTQASTEARPAGAEEEQEERLLQISYS